MKKDVVAETAGDGTEKSLEEKTQRCRPPQAAGDAPAPSRKKRLTISSNQVAGALNKLDVPASASAVNRNVKRRVPSRDRANIVRRCAMEVGYTSEERANSQTPEEAVTAQLRVRLLKKAEHENAGVRILRSASDWRLLFSRPADNPASSDNPHNGSYIMR